MRGWSPRTRRGAPRLIGDALARAGGRAPAARRFLAGHARQATAAAPVLAAAVAAVLAVTLTGSSAPPGHGPPGAQRLVLPVGVPAAELARLPRATTYTSIPAAPGDPAPFALTSGLVVHPLAPQVVYSGPGKPPVAVLPPTELGAPTWVPVVQSSPGWERVLLPSRPNRATGWLYTGGSQLDTRRSTYLVRISTGARTLRILDGGRLLGTWTAAVGAPATPTPTGRTFLLALLAPPHPPTARSSCRSGSTPTRSTPTGAAPARSACTAGPTRRCSAAPSATAACGYPRPRCTSCPRSRSAASS